MLAPLPAVRKRLQTSLVSLWKYLDASARVPLVPKRHGVRDSLCICRKRALARAWCHSKDTLSREPKAKWILGKNGPPSFSQQILRGKEEVKKPTESGGEALKEDLM